LFFYKIEILWFNIDFEFIYLRVAAPAADPGKRDNEWA
jgi:hypothetical protein